MMADRIGVIRRGELILVEEKNELMKKLGQKQMIVHLQEPLSELPDAVADRGLVLSDDGLALTYSYDTNSKRTGITSLLRELSEAGVRLRDVETRERSLEEIFVTLVREGEAA